ncbi:fungal specific transcription factor [Aspergillus flavus]|uniref:Fungal specific transcription factor n=1 Tax=Aspergillus flavus TaxID=5059 RepID=A0AB74BZD0_ASPFL|nr:fungal specific transcription factor [Aspergillus flavus]
MASIVILIRYDYHPLPPESFSQELKTMSAPNDNYTIHKVSLKRTRQACGPCRRKKARCPGEKPTCSLCQRLGQRCSYGPQAAPSRAATTRASPANGQERALGEAGDANLSSAQRFERIEDRLDKMAGILQECLLKNNPLTGFASGSSHPSHGYGHRSMPNSPVAFGFQNGERHYSLGSSLPCDFVKSEVEIYLAHFHDQPYCVFPKDWLLSRDISLAPELAFPLVALTSRISRRSPGLTGSEVPPTKYYANKAWDILSHQYKSGKLGLSFLQGTFLMAQVDFANGQSHRGYSSVALGLRTIQSAGLNKDKYTSSLTDSEAEERRRITWSFFMLDRSYNASRDYSLCLADKHFTILFPAPDTPASLSGEESLARGTLHDGPEKQGEKLDHGILACLLRLYSIWGKTTDYVFEPFDKDALPPWRSGSSVAGLESDWMQFETHFADTHRYRNVDFRRRAREEPHCRSYLCTWLCVQFLFHSVQCLLHHPFVNMVKLRHIDGNIPATFLQKSYESSLIHSRWIARFIREMDEVDIRLYDPFIGYLCAIAATIQLENTSSKNPHIAQLGNSDFRTLVDYMTELSTHWENMGVLVNRVNKLAARQKNYKSLYYSQDTFSGELTRMPTPSTIPRMSEADEALMWNILDFSSSFTPAEIGQLGDLVPSPYQRMETTSPNFPVATGQTTEQGLESLSGRIPGPIGADPISEWPFSDRRGNGGFDAALPDLPDWMMFGDYVAEQL